MSVDPLGKTHVTEDDIDEMFQVLCDLLEAGETNPLGGVRPDRIAEELTWTASTVRRRLGDDPRVEVSWGLKPGSGPVKTLTLADASEAETPELRTDGGQVYCRACGWVDPADGYHPEYGPIDVCPDCGPFGPGVFEDPEQLIEMDHERAVRRRGHGLLTDGGKPQGDYECSSCDATIEGEEARLLGGCPECGASATQMFDDLDGGLFDDLDTGDDADDLFDSGGLFDAGDGQADDRDEQDLDLAIDHVADILVDLDVPADSIAAREARRLADEYGGIDAPGDDAVTGTPTAIAAGAVYLALKKEMYRDRGRRITREQVSEASGVSPTTITRQWRALAKSDDLEIADRHRDTDDEDEDDDSLLDVFLRWLS
jgi:hypothetical protein